MSPLHLHILSLLLLVFNTHHSKSNSVHPSTCEWTDPIWGETFNFYGLYLQAGGQLPYYTVQDNDVDSENPLEELYDYYFNLCGHVLEYPKPECNTTQMYCPNQNIDYTAEPHTCSGKSEISGLTYAYQVSNKEGETFCWALSNNQVSQDNYGDLISLLDPLDPTQGFNVTYKGGTWADSTCGRNRVFSVLLHCENDAAAIPRSSNVIEVAPCKYELHLYTVHGCPTGCTSYANSLCASQGLCGYDFSTNKSHCFCYWGYDGSSCQDANADAYWAEFGWNKPLNRKHDDATSEQVHTFITETTITEPLGGLVKTVIVNVTYDLRDAYTPEDLYIVDDSNEDLQYKYYFNIAGKIDSERLPDECKKVNPPCDDLTNLQACYDDQKDNTTYREITGYAFRFFNGTKTDSDDSCVLLGQDMSWALYDLEDNPAHGVSLTYSNGSYNGGYDGYDYEVCNKNYQLQVDLICPDTRNTYEEYFNPSEELEFAEEVERIEPCSYKLSFETALACPFNCVDEVAESNQGTNIEEDAFAVCSGRGMCVADPVAGFVRCICDSQWFGDDCDREYPSPGSSSSSSPHSHTGYNVAIAIIAILLVGFIIAVVYLFMRNKVLEKYAVPMLPDDVDRDQIEPRVPDYSDSDSGKEMVNISSGGAQSKNDAKKDKKKSKKDKKKFKRKQKLKTRKGYSNQLNADYSSEDDDDENNADNYDNDADDDQNPQARHYLAAGQDDSDSDDD